VLERDGRQCQLRYSGCIGQATEADHKRRGDDHSLSNLQAACSPCHQRKSSSEGGQAWSAKRGSGKLPAESHPGLI
jgi:5-methylcytosine-specific restriction endonuclease McrA